MRVITLLLCLASFVAFTQKAVPELWGQRIHDEAHMLSPSAIEQLELELKNYEDSTSNQIAILIVSSTDGMSIEDYALQVAEKWKLGSKKNDNGILILIATEDHKMRIEVGQGLEGVLTDIQCNRIIRNEMAPNFRRNDYDAGIQAAIVAITQAIRGEYVASDSGTLQGNDLDWPMKILIGVFIFGILMVFTFIAVFTKGCAGWGMYAFLIPFYAAFPWVVLGMYGAVVLLIAYIVIMPIVKLILAKSNWAENKLTKWQRSSSRSGSGWSMGSGWGSSSGGGSSFGDSGSSSGFSGGGGSFGGGGSSGSW